jgi:protein SCO1/2
MNINLHLSISCLLSATLALLLSSCSPSATETPPLQGAAIGGPFELTNQDGNRVRNDDFDGKYRLIYFGFTYCPDVCPVDLQLVGQAMRKLEKDDPPLAAKVQPIFITVDPDRDTPQVMKQYVAAFHPRLIGLTGSREEIAAVAKRYGVYFQKEEETADEEYLVDHSRILLLFGPSGEPISIVPHDKGADAIAADVERWVK